MKTPVAPAQQCPFQLRRTGDFPLQLRYTCPIPPTAGVGACNFAPGAKAF
jgi:hypothetical protein